MQSLNPSDQAYVVLARRYRPTQFGQVIGQQHVTQTLQNAIERGRIHHAYLFTGSRGVGKTTIARILAKSLNCEKGPTATPCEQCDACQQAAAGASVDVQEIDGASHTGVDDVRQLRDGVRYMPAQGRYKIYIIDEVHMLSTSAFNALLKTLEEPPAHAVFILATTEPQKIPATILSRCQRYDFKRVPSGVLVGHLQQLCIGENVTVDPAGLTVIARASEGSVRDSLSLLDQVLAYSAGSSQVSSAQVAEILGVADRRILFELSAAVSQRQTDAALNVIDRLFADGQDLAHCAQAFLAHLRDMVVVKTCQSPAALVDATEAELVELTEQVKNIDRSLLEQYFDRFYRATNELLRSAYPKLVWEMALIEMALIEPLMPLSDILQRLEKLQSQLGTTTPQQSSPPRSGGKGGSDVGPMVSKPVEAKRPIVSAAPNNNDVEVVEAKPNSLSPDVAEALSNVVADESTQQRWLNVLQKLETFAAVAAGVLASGRLLNWQNNVIELGFTPGAFELQLLSDSTKRESFEQHIAKAGGDKVQLKPRALTAQELASPDVVQLSARETAARKRVELDEQLRQEALSHPLARALVDRFGAKVESLTTIVE